MAVELMFYVHTWSQLHNSVVRQEVVRKDNVIVMLSAENGFRRMYVRKTGSPGGGASLRMYVCSMYVHSKSSESKWKRVRAEGNSSEPWRQLSL